MGEKSCFTGIQRMIFIYGSYEHIIFLTKELLYLLESVILCGTFYVVAAVSPPPPPSEIFGMYSRVGHYCMASMVQWPKFDTWD